MTQINFKRTGTDREAELNVDLNSLPASESQNLMRLVTEAGFFELPENLGTAGTLDEPQYVITVEYGTNRRHTVHVNDAAVPQTLRPLIEGLSELADAQSA